MRGWTGFHFHQLFLFETLSKNKNVILQSKLYFASLNPAAFYELLLGRSFKGETNKQTLVFNLKIKHNLQREREIECTTAPICCSFESIQ
jgi:hypothetical protein